MGKIVLEFAFDVENPEDPIEEHFHRPRKVKRLKVEGLTDRDIDGVLESLYQSDFGQIDFPNAVLEALEGKTTKFNR